MKRIAFCFLLICTFCGCGLLRETSYVAVEPHNEDYGVAMDSDVLTVSSYLSLKNALLNVIQDGNEDVVIRAESYSGNLGDDLSQAVHEVANMSPLGAYAVSSMTYDYSRIVNYYEIHMNVAYKRTRDEIQSILYASDMNAVLASIRQAMQSYESRLLLRVGDYHAMDLAAAIETIYLEHPEYCMELPSTNMELFPESGTQRILEITFDYALTAEEQLERRTRMEAQIEAIVSLYGNANKDLTNARRLYERLGRNAVLEPIQNGNLFYTSAAYEALIEERSSSYGYAQAYRLLLDACGISCQLISGQKNGMTHYWCLIRIDGNYYYVDPSQATGTSPGMSFLMGNRELEWGGYFLWDDSVYPSVELPWYLKPEPGSSE